MITKWPDQEGVLGLPMLIGYRLMTLPLLVIVSWWSESVTAKRMSRPMAMVADWSLAKKRLPIAMPASAARTVTWLPGRQKTSGRYMTWLSVNQRQAPTCAGLLTTNRRFWISTRWAAGIGTPK